MAKEWGRFNVNVNVVAYGFIETRLTGEKEAGSSIEIEGQEIAVGVPQATRAALKVMAPLGRAGTPEEAAGPVLFLASPLSNYVTGELIICSGGVAI